MEFSYFFGCIDLSLAVNKKCVVKKALLILYTVLFAILVEMETEKKKFKIASFYWCQEPVCKHIHAHCTAGAAPCNFVVAMI